jgi:hypothetical protein
VHAHRAIADNDHRQGIYRLCRIGKHGFHYRQGLRHRHSCTRHTALWNVFAIALPTKTFADGQFIGRARYGDRVALVYLYRLPVLQKLCHACGADF